MKRSWTFAAGGTIWRVHPAVSGRIVGEERDLEQRRVTFFALDFSTGKVLWKGLAAGEQWWTGIDRVEGDLLFVHGFASPDLPTHQGITVIDIAQGRMLWASVGWTLEAVKGDRLIVRGDHRLGQGMLVIESRTGEILAGEEPPTAHAAEDQLWRDEVAFPDPVSVEELASHGAARIILGKWHREEISGMVELLELPPRVLVAAALRRKGFREETMHQELLVVNMATGKTEHSVTLMRHSRGPVMESFFVQNGTLVFVREGKTLCGVMMGEA
ncbi:MAG: DUF4905 domain-containing protein [Bacteroidetes bacterium]|nr:DUF4905 domain-containing protein [Bacteroidota bacterium]